MRRAPLLAAAVFAAAQLGCTAGERLVMSANEYGVYRRARASETLEDRLSASQEYLIRYPSGTYAPDVRAFFTRTEAAYFADAKQSIEGLEAYLRALPRGPNAKEAAIRLRDLRALDKAERTDLAGKAVVIDATVAREAERRKAVRDRIEQWLGLFLDPAVLAAPMIEAKASVIVPWSLALPWPICERTGAGPDAPKGPPGAARRCTKLLQLDYRATEDGEAQERQALVEIAVWQDEAGRPLEVTLGGPELFLRLDETVTARGAVATDPEARLRGAERAVELAQKVFAGRVSADASCTKPADSDVLRLVCKGVELRVLAGALDGEDDRFAVRAAR
jgi:hypothetical protein